MKIKKGFVLRQIGDEQIVVGEGLEQVDFNKIICLNSSAAYLWENLQGRDFTNEDAAHLLTEKYDVDSDKAIEDVGVLLSSWKGAGLIE